MTVPASEKPAVHGSATSCVRSDPAPALSCGHRASSGVAPTARFLAIVTATSSVRPAGGARGLGRGGLVPRLSEFYGIVIYMYFSDHNPPHFHAIYGKARRWLRSRTGP